MERAAQVARQWQDAFNSHDEHQIRSVLDADARLAGPNGVFEGRSAITAYMMAWVEAFPDGRYAVQHMTSDGDTVVVESLFTGTHTGTLVDPSGDIPASNRRVEGRSAHAVVVENGVVKEVRMYFDVYAFLTQLGVLSGPATT